MLACLDNVLCNCAGCRRGGKQICCFPVACPLENDEMVERAGERRDGARLDAEGVRREQQSGLRGLEEITCRVEADGATRCLERRPIDDARHLGAFVGGQLGASQCGDHQGHRVEGERTSGFAYSSQVGASRGAARREVIALSSPGRTSPTSRASLPSKSAGSCGSTACLWQWVEYGRDFRAVRRAPKGQLEGSAGRLASDVCARNEGRQDSSRDMSKRSNNVSATHSESTWHRSRRQCRQEPFGPSSGTPRFGVVWFCLVLKWNWSSSMFFLCVFVYLCQRLNC